MSEHSSLEEFKVAVMEVLEDYALRLEPEDLQLLLCVHNVLENWNGDPEEVLGFDETNYSIYG